MRFTSKTNKRSSAKVVASLIVVAFIVLVVAAAVIIRNTYNSNLGAVSNVSKTQVITIEPGATTAEIAKLLKDKNVIKSDWAFEWYVRNEHLRDSLKAGTYVVDQNQSVQQIVMLIVEGKVATDLITILPGKTLEETKKSLIDDGFTKKEVEDGLDPAKYAGHPALTDKPPSATLEGYLYPETFQKTADTTVKQIVSLSLDEMDRRLTPELRKQVSEQGLTLHEAITLASIIENESSSAEDRPKVAQVFLKRLSIDKPLESNATDRYAAKNPKYDSYSIDGLPPGPISNFSESSLEAVAYPSETSYLYFVTGDDGKTYFSKTFEEHQALVDKHCTDACAH